MDYLLIRNAGEMELEALTLMGATSKAGDDTKIGFFGSGNKYALATLLRHNTGIWIYSGQKDYKITCTPVNFRGQEYHQILINNVATSLTTRLGPAWEIWMAVRELYCNALDEGLLLFDIVSEFQEPRDGETSIYLVMTPEIQDFMDNKGSYINDNEVLESIATCYGTVDILRNQKGARFRKNICCVNGNCGSLYGYNYDSIQINESRLVQYDYQQYEQIACALAKTVNAEIITNYIRHANDETLLEARAKWEKGYCKDILSVTWESVLIGLNMPVIAKTVASFVGREKAANCICLPDELVAKIRLELPNVPMYGVFDTQSMASEASPELLAEVQRCMDIMVSWGFDAQVIQFRKFFNKNILAQFYDSEIYFSIDCPLDKVMETLYEEVIHKITGFGDCCRELQDYLFREIIRLQEEVHK